MGVYTTCGWELVGGVGRGWGSLDGRNLVFSSGISGHSPASLSSLLPVLGEGGAASAHRPGCFPVCVCESRP